MEATQEESAERCQGDWAVYWQYQDDYSWEGEEGERYSLRESTHNQTTYKWPI